MDHRDQSWFDNSSSWSRWTIPNIIILLSTFPWLNPSFLDMMIVPYFIINCCEKRSVNQEVFFAAYVYVVLYFFVHKIKIWIIIKPILQNIRKEGGKWSQSIYSNRSNIIFCSLRNCACGSTPALHAKSILRVNKKTTPCS